MGRRVPRGRKWTEHVEVEHLSKDEYGMQAHNDGQGASRPTHTDENYGSNTPKEKAKATGQRVCRKDAKGECECPNRWNEATSRQCMTTLAQLYKVIDEKCMACFKKEPDSVTLVAQTAKHKAWEYFEYQRRHTDNWSRNKLRALNLEAFAAACFYVASRSNSYAFSLRELSDGFGGKRRMINKHVIDFYRSNLLKRRYASSIDFVPRFCDILGLPSCMVSKAKLLSQEYELYNSSKKSALPAMLAAASIVVVLHSAGLCHLVTLERASKLLKLNGDVLRKICENMLEFVDIHFINGSPECQEVWK